MRERIALRADLLAQVERRAKVDGRPFEDAFATTLARGLLATLFAQLAPLLGLDDERPRLGPGGPP